VPASAHTSRTRHLERLAELGLGYLSLGQPLTDAVRRRPAAAQLAAPWPRRVASTSSTSRPQGSISATSSICSVCSTGS